MWIASLAGKYPPQLCRAAADLIATVQDAPSGLAPTKVERCWDVFLAKAHGGVWQPQSPARPSVLFVGGASGSTPHAVSCAVTLAPSASRSSRRRGAVREPQVQSHWEPAMASSRLQQLELRNR